MQYNRKGSIWNEKPGPAMPNVVSSWDAVPTHIQNALEALKMVKGTVSNLVAGPVLRFMQEIHTLFGPISIVTMWNPKNGNAYSPQAVIAIPPAQAVLAIVDLFEDPHFMFIARTRDLAVDPEYVMPFWKEGLTPSINALLDYAGIETLEAPRGALADGVGFAVPQEAVEELGMEVGFFFKAHAGANPDPGMLACELPHMIAVMDTTRQVTIDERESITFNKFRLISPENLINELRTPDGVSLSQVMTFLQTVAFDLDENYPAALGDGSPAALTTETVRALKILAWRVLQGPLDHMQANW